MVVLFWSFGCEASLLAARQLVELADRWPDGVTVLAVHTPRFPYEEDEAKVLAATERHRIDLPVINDPDYITWNRYNPGGWPAVVVVDKRGRVVGINGGTSDMDVIGEAVATELGRPGGRRESGLVVDVDRPDHGPAHRRSGAGAGGEPSVSTSTGVDRASDSTLRFPSGVAVTASGRLIIADSGHDRLLIGEIDSDLRTFRPEVEITDIDNPTAVACASDTIIYVVESGTGSVLQVDLDYGTLDVLADDEVAAPTALLVDIDGSVVVADAGHDVLLRIAGGTEGEILFGTIAGSGFSGARDGNAGQAELAQPVAVARTTNGVAFCDAASSNVRLLTDNGKVVTITGNDFFDWGLVDGPANRARLQRPSDVAVRDDGSIVVADTGNDRLRVLADRQIRTLGLSGLDQPTGVAILPSGHLLVADSGHHRLVVADPDGCTAWPLAVYPAVMTSVWEDDLPIEHIWTDDGATASPDDLS